MEDILTNFHFVRPLWFWAVIPAVLLYLLLRHRASNASNWEDSIDPGLLPFLLENAGERKAHWIINGLLAAWLITIVSLAGPVWSKIPQPVHEREDALIIILDATRSMYATDESPNRMVRARRKLTDLLNERKEGVTALIAFAGDAHVVSPLTDDAHTILELLASVAPEIMPAPGSRLTPALSLAYQLFTDAGMATGTILIVTDEIRDVAESQALARANRNAYPVSVLAIGTEEGAPVDATRLQRNAPFLRDEYGNLVIPKVSFGALSDFATIAGGRFSQVTLNDQDLEYLLAPQDIDMEEEFREVDREFDNWFEEGPWFLLVLIPFCALAFRRGWIWVLALIAVMPVDHAEASVWDDLWKTRDQQAMEAMKEGDTRSAATLFEDPAWKATARYRSEDYEGAASAFSQLDTSDGHYNRGNALTNMGMYDQAIAAYDRALELNPDNEDAAFNREIARQLLEKKNREEQEKSDDGQNGDDQGENGEDDQQQSEESNDEQQDPQEGDQASDQETDQQQQQNAQPGDKKEDGNENEEPSQQQMSMEDEKPSEEEAQALRNWLQKIPDDPGGLLKRKFEMQYNERIKKGEINGNGQNSNW